MLAASAAAAASVGDGVLAGISVVVISPFVDPGSKRWRTARRRGEELIYAVVTAEAGRADALLSSVPTSATPTSQK